MEADADADVDADSTSPVRYLQQWSNRYIANKPKEIAMNDKRDQSARLHLNVGNFIYGEFAYVDSFGQWLSGGENVLVFHPEALTDAQWETLGNLHESDRENYVWAIIHGDTATINQIEIEQIEQENN